MDAGGSPSFLWENLHRRCLVSQNVQTLKKGEEREKIIKKKHEKKHF